MTAALDLLSDIEIGWLLDQGVSPTAMLEPTLIYAANVVFLDGHTFDFDSGGIRALVLKEANDLVAWNPKRKILATWRSSAFALGEDAIWNPASYFMGTALRVHESALEWLQADRDGIVILKPDLTAAYLGHVPRLSFADPLHAQRVKRWCQPPTPSIEFLLEVPEEEIAA
jgi:prepilin-type processing-associated H-X9-DG protein